MTRFKQFRNFFCRTALAAPLAICLATPAKGGAHV